MDKRKSDETDKPENERIPSILTFIKDYITKHGTPPTIREIGDYESLSSTSTVNFWLDKLVIAGYITREPGKPRHIKFTTEGLKRIGITEVIVR